jgi:hypothetical protein
MSNQSTAQTIKKRNIIDMALTFTAMVRVFEKKSKERITNKLYELSEKLDDVHTKEQFEEIHSEFCHWFVSEITTAEKNLKNRTRKEACPASYGHAAKVFDIAMKVYVYY